MGKGNWEGFDVPLERVYEAAAEWRQALTGVSRPWLCWNVSDRWCKLQQRLIQEVGWTPVIGSDPRSRPPTVLPGSILIDFNSHFGLEVMWPHFPLEFAFLFADRLAFWHADLLCSLDVMRNLKSTFESLPDGAMAAVPPTTAAGVIFSNFAIIGIGNWQAAQPSRQVSLSLNTVPAGGGVSKIILNARTKMSAVAAPGITTIPELASCIGSGATVAR